MFTIMLILWGAALQQAKWIFLEEPSFTAAWLATSGLFVFGSWFEYGRYKAASALVTSYEGYFEMYEEQLLEREQQQRRATRSVTSSDGSAGTRRSAQQEAELSYSIGNERIYVD